MTNDLKLATAATVKMGPFIDATDGVTPLPSLTIQKANVRLAKNGGNYAPASADQGVADAGAPYDELGDYDIDVDTTDTGTQGRLRVHIQMSGALPVWRDFIVGVNDPGGRVAIQSGLVRGTEGKVSFLMKDSTTHAPVTGLTVAVAVSIDGAAYGASTNAVVEEGLGTYSLILTAAERDGAEILLSCTATGADATVVTIITDP
jgi:hypothetical protein